MFNRIQIRCASVLANLPPNPHTSHSLHQTQPHIVTPASQPITARSNNAFHPNYIPKNTKERLALDELYKVLDNSKAMYKILENRYLEKNMTEEQDSSLKDLLEEHPTIMASTLDVYKGNDAIFGEQDDDYLFPRQLIPETMKNENKTPLVIVACGSYSPITYLHLRMFEMARDHFNGRFDDYELIAGYYSPVSDAYKKEGLVEAKHRVKMCELAVESTSDWLMVDSWESRQSMYQRTAVVLDHFDHQLNQIGRGIKTKSGDYKKVKIMLLAGGDLMASFGHPGVWSSEDLHHIVGRYGCVIIERTGTDVYGFLLSHDILYQHRLNVLIIKQLIHNDISSTKIRLFVKRGMSVKYLLPNPVIDYIAENKLYHSDYHAS
ncbi:hypothetical protein BD560DRAFT_451070 [Blakeslea trispora]|nr:hypothetical protein BD560DRAFT_451070 [Blakeslea trispora]